ncbi:MAG: hypothetical protein ACI9DC_001649 [Gammaproteobacteria bacterium]|jgi:hypothetical protein
MIRTEADTVAHKPRITRSSAALLCVALLVSVGSVQAAQEAHEHGKGELNVIVEGRAVRLQLRVPGVDVVGFEHTARTEQEKAAVATARERFASPERLFELSAAATCVVTKAAASFGGEQAAHGKAEKDNHGHGDKHDAHSELSAEYYFECAAPALLKHLVVNVFDHLSAKALRTAVVTGQQQTSIELSPSDRTIDFTP